MIYECIKQYNDIPVGMFIEKDTLPEDYFKPVVYLRKYNIISEWNLVNAVFPMNNLPFVEYTCIKDFKGIKEWDTVIETDDYVKLYSEPNDDFDLRDVKNTEYFKSI